MATIKKPVLPLKPSVNPKIGTTILAKPDAKKVTVSKLTTSVAVKKPPSIAAKAPPVKPTTTPKPSLKPVASSMPKTTVKSSSVSAPTATIKSAADSTSSLKPKVVAKPSVKTALPPSKPVSAAKSVVAKPVLKKAQPAANTETKKPSITTIKSAGLSKPVTEKSTTLPAKSTKVSLPLKSFASSTPIKTKTSSTLSTPIKAKSSVMSKISNSPIAKTPLKSPSLAKSPIKSLTTSAKTASKLSTVLKPVKKPVALASTKKIQTRPSLNPDDVIKRLQDESEIEIRDADSTTIEEERDNEEFSAKLCECDENGNFEERPEAVDEQRVYAVAEQLIGVMQPEELEVITADVPEQPASDNNSCVIDMSALESVEPETEDSHTPLVDESTLQDTTNKQITVAETTDDEVLIEILKETDSPSEELPLVETFDSQVLVEISQETASVTAAEEQEILDMYERKVQELTDIYRCTVDIPVVLGNEESMLNGSENEEDTPIATDIVNELEEDSLVVLSSPAVVIEDDLQESTIISESSDDSLPTVIEREIELESSLISNSELSASLCDTSEIQLLNETCTSNDDVFEDQLVANIEQPLEESEQESNIDGEKDDFEDSRESCDPEINDSLIFSELDNDPLISLEHSEDAQELINLESDVDEMVDNKNVVEDHFYPEGEMPTYNEDTFTVVSQSIIDSEIINIAEDQIFDTPEKSEEDSVVTNDCSDSIDMSYAEAVQSLKILTDDVLEATQSYELHSLVENAQTTKAAVDTGVIYADIPIISVYDAAEFPESVPSDEHYEKQEDQHDESFHRIRRKRNKRRNKKNRKPSNAENFDDHTSPKNVYGEKHQNYEENYPMEYHGKRRNSRRWRNSRSYYEAFHQLPHNQEYYADPHWKFTPKMD